MKSLFVAEDVVPPGKAGCVCDAKKNGEVPVEIGDGSGVDGGGR